MKLRGGWALYASLAVLAAVLAWPAGAAHINVVTIDGSINPASSDYIQQAISQSERDGAAAVLIELDTPGGLLSATKDIIQAILNTPVPIIVYVSPRGAWAASAGTFITLSGHVAAMAPSTSIGAASPVSAGGGGERDKDGEERSSVSEEKAEKFISAFIESIADERKRNVEWARKAVREAEAITEDDALELGVIDLVAQNRQALLAEIDGRELEIKGEKRILETADAELRQIEMTTLMRVFNFLSDPNIAMLLFAAGLLGLYIEFNQPGMIFPGVAGALCLVLAAIAFQILPFSWVGLMLTLLGMGLIVAELFVPSFGMLFAAGLVCFLLGGSMIFDMPEVSDLTISFWSVLVPMVAAFGLIAGLVLVMVGRSLARGQTAGISELLGLVGEATTALEPNGRVFVRGEYWTARADEQVRAGERVEITEVNGLRLRVRRARSEV